MPQPNNTQLMQREGRIALAMDALKHGHFTSVRDAAKSYDLVHTTLQRRVNGGLQNAIYDLRTVNSQIQRSQHLSNGYYLWINVVYHLDLTLYDEWQTYSFKNDPIQAKAVAVAVALANYGFITLYDDTKH